MAKNTGYKIGVGFINFICIAVTIIASFACIAWLYLTLTDGFPKSITTAYVSTITNEYGQDEPVMSATYYSAENGTGKEMFELKMTYYTGIQKQATKSYGIQFFEDKYYYYDSYHEISWSSVSEYDEKNPMIIEIDDTTYGIALEGTYQKATINIFKTVWFGIEGLITGWTNSYERIHDFETVEYGLTISTLKCFGLEPCEQLIELLRRKISAVREGVEEGFERAAVILLKEALCEAIHICSSVDKRIILTLFSVFFGADESSVFKSDKEGNESRSAPSLFIADCFH